MSNLNEEIKDRLLRAAAKRARGDALKDRAGREEDSLDAYKAALGEYNKAVDLLKERVESWEPKVDLPVCVDQKGYVDDLVESLGARGGIYRRLKEPEKALASYQEGAKYEWKFGLSNTYNRVNKVKYSLVTGQSKLSDLKEEIESLARLLKEQLDVDKSLSDKGWAWADLGDCRALLGDFDGAETAYRSFIDKAETKAPEATLEVLTRVAEKLRELGDPIAGHLASAVAILKGRLHGD